MDSAQQASFVALGTAIQRTYADAFQSDPGSIDFSDLGFQQVDHITATDPGGADRNFGAVLVGADGTGPATIAIHGTQTQAEWLADGWAVPHEVAVPGFMVHKGFWDIFQTFRLGSARPMLPTLTEMGVLVVTGHSLGGPLATGLAALSRASNLVCFASPKPGDRRFSDWVQRNVTSITLLANPNDEVPKLPVSGPPPFDYQHVAPLTPIGPGDVPAEWEPSHIITSYLSLLTLLSPIETQP